MSCPTCGHKFRAVQCQCRGHIINAESWKLGRWDWRPLFGSFSDNVRPMDIDCLIERRGQFLVFETKSGSADIPVGQRRALEALARIPQFTVAALWGEPDEPTAIQECVNGVWTPQRAFTRGELWHLGSDWWLRVNRRRTA